MNVGQLTPYVYEKLTGRLMDSRIRSGFVLEGEYGAPLMVVGVYEAEGRHVLFSRFADYFRAQLATFRGRRGVAMAARRAMEMIAMVKGPVDAYADQQFQGSEVLLEHMGFRHLGGRVYRYGGLTLHEKVRIAEAQMKERGEPVEIPVRHYFSDGLYAREIRIPAGTILTGKIHKRANLNILSEGEISVLTERGVQRVRAPFTVVSPAGTKRIAYTHTDVTWTTIHGTVERDLDKIEEIFICQSEEDFLGYVRGLEEREAA